MARKQARCGTKAGFNRHKRTIGDEPCQPCREAENAARRELRRNPVPPKPRCESCGKEIRKPGETKCAECRKSSEWRPCAHCSERAWAGNRLCVTCAEVDATLPAGWVRDGRGILRGSNVPHNDPYRCTAHHICDQQQRDEEAA